jgi:hypothetical protein
MSRLESVVPGKADVRRPVRIYGFTPSSHRALSQFPLSRRGQPDGPFVERPVKQPVSRDGFDHRPILPEECRGVVNVGSLHLDTASLSGPVVRHLKMKRIARRIRAFIGRPALAAHLVSPMVRRTGTL